MATGAVFFDFGMGSASTGGTGDVTGPGSSTDNAIARFDGTGGKKLQNSGVTIDDSEYMSGLAALVLDEQSIITVPSAGQGLVWVKNDAPTNPYFVDDVGGSQPFLLGPTGSSGDLFRGGSNGGRTTRVSADSILVDQSITEYTTKGSTSTRIPADTSAPLSTEGAEVTTHSHTPKASGNLLHVRVTMNAGINGANSPSWTAALFVDSGLSSVRSAGASNQQYYLSTVVLDYTMTAPSTSAITFKMRAGPNNASDSLRWNQAVFSGADQYNQTAAVVIEVKEYTP